MTDDEPDDDGLRALLKPTHQPAHQWTVVCPTVNDTTPAGKNRSAVRVSISDGVDIIELCRVGVVRRNSKNPKVEFTPQLQAEIDKANEIVTTINEHLQYLEELREAAADYTRKHVQSIVGRQSAVPV
jgi:hypothetical protein